MTIQHLLEGKVALVTGGARGIGKACAEELSGVGAAVVILDKLGGIAAATAREIESRGGKAAVVVGDLSQIGTIADLVTQAEKAFGRIDILVNNAGISQPTETETLDQGQWDRIMDINLKAVFFVTQAVLPLLRRQGGGAIVNLSSIVARSGGVNSTVDYTISKSGVLGMTRVLARQYGPENIRVNAVTPGPIMTEMIGSWPKERLADLESRIPLRRLGTPKDVATSVTFLASPWAGWLTGVAIDVAGGLYMA
jgi:3-oxoacyl-[acyl-carrier protein] reductase